MRATMTPGKTRVKMATQANSGTETAVDPERHLLLMIALALQRQLTRMRTVREPSLDALHERVDHRRLHLVALLPARRDRRVAFVLGRSDPARDESWVRSGHE